MLETGLRQFRMAWAMIWGLPIDTRTVERLVQDALRTLHEFGTPGDDVQQLIEGPFSDPAARRDFQNRALQRTIRRLVRVSPHYRRQLASLALDRARITVADMPDLPVTLKADLQEHSRMFIASDSQPHILTRTTGTTGRPTEVWLSRYETELWSALAALAGLLRNEITPDDSMQINISSRATAAVQQTISVCRLLGVRVRMLGIIPPDESLDSLLGGDGSTLLSTYPSYLAQLVEAAQRRHLRSSDFRLRRIDCGGEILSSGLARAAREVLGPELVNDSFGMTEVLPVSGRTCNQGHLHHDLNTGYVEVIDLESGRPAAPGALGTLVVTPYYPYRECMPVLRYDTRDLVRRLPDESLTCDQSGVPATSHVLGKADELIHLGRHLVTPRDIVELLEATHAGRRPARFSACVADGVLELTLPESALQDSSGSQLEQSFRASGLHVAVRRSPSSGSGLTNLRPLRADLVERTFASGDTSR